MRTFLLSVCVLLALVACNYREPQAKADPATRPIAGATRQQVVDAAVAELAAEGFQPIADDKRGLVTTAPKRSERPREQPCQLAWMLTTSPSARVLDPVAPRRRGFTILHVV